MDWFADFGKLNFAAPQALWLLAFVPALVAAHFMRSRPRARLVPDLSLWEEFLAQAEGSRSFQSLEELLSLLARLVLLIACALAAAGAFLGSAESDPPPLALAVIIDTSASMSATDVPGYRDRLAAAKALAGDLIEHRLAPGDRCTLITTGGQVWGAGLGDSQRLAALYGLRFELGARHDLRAAVALGRELIAQAGIPRVLVIGDGGGAAAMAAARGEVPGLLHVAVGTTGANVGLSELELAPRQLSANNHRLQVVVTNFGSKSIEVELRQRGELPPTTDPVLRVELGAEEHRTLQFDLPGNEAAFDLALVTDPPDPFPDDNHVYAGLTRLAPASVVVAAARREDIAWVAAALAALGDHIDRANAAQTSLERLPALPLGDRVPDAILALGPGRLPEGTPPASVLLLGCDAPELGVTSRGEIVAPLVWESSANHPLLSGISFAELQIGSALALELAPGFEVLASDPGGRPLIAIAHPSQDRTVAVVAFSPSASNFGQLAAFPLLLRNALDTFHDYAATTVEGIYQTGETITSRRLVEAPRPVPVEFITSFADEAGPRRLAPVAVVAGEFEFKDASRPGLYAFEIEGQPRYAGVNRRLEPVESDIAPVPSGQVLADVLADVPRPAPRRPLLTALLHTALAAFLLDAILFAAGRRRRSGD